MSRTMEQDYRHRYYADTVPGHPTCADEDRVHPRRALVGFTGRRGSGKDTAAKALTDAGYQRISFAGPLKAMLYALLRGQGVDGQDAYEMIEGSRKEVTTPYLNGRSPRFAMQTLGTEWGRDAIHPDIWVDAAMRAAMRHHRVVITDVRFPNEVAAIQAAGGVVIRVNRPDRGDADAHQSEALIDSLGADADIYNVGSVENLHRHTLIALERLAT